MSVRKKELEREIERIREKLAEAKRLAAYKGRSTGIGYLERKIKELQKAIDNLK